MAVPGYSEARASADAAVTEALTRGGSPADAARAAVTAAEAFFDNVRRTVDLHTQLSRMACKSGCAWCCYQVVAVTSAELALVEDAIARLPDETQRTIRTRAAEAVAKGAGLDPSRYWAAHIRCPLLDDDECCAVHADRPMACRAFNSADAEACHRSFLGQPQRIAVLAAQHGTWAHSQAGLADALARAGITPGPVALTEGLASRL
jgi:Fe-S-cluster containining protein